MLKIKCKDCDKRFPASYQQDRVSFGATNFTEQLEKCPNCGNVRPYFKINYFFEESWVAKLLFLSPIAVVGRQLSYSWPIKFMSRVCSSSTVLVVGTRETISSSRPAAMRSVNRADTVASFPDITKLSTRASGMA